MSAVFFFKQKTAYEICACLVGSEMCIRDSYESEPKYIDALIKSVKEKLGSIKWKPDLIISSYHGIPKKYFDKGDPYHCYCHKTTRLMKENFNEIDFQTTFQSRFGPQEWLTPYTDKTLESLPSKGVKIC